MLPNGSGESFHLTLFPDNRCEAVADDGGCVVVERATHDENLRLIVMRDVSRCEGFAKGSALRGVGDSQPFRSCPRQNRSADYCAMAVGVCFHYGEHCSFAAGSVGQHAVVVDQPLL